jgi:hypothetical protein
MYHYKLALASYVLQRFAKIFPLLTPLPFYQLLLAECQVNVKLASIYCCRRPRNIVVLFEKVEASVTIIFLIIVTPFT